VTGAPRAFRAGGAHGGVRRPHSLRTRLPRRPALPAALLLAGLVATGCISEEREQAIGDQMAADVNPHLPIIDDPLLNAYVHAVGMQLAATSSRPDLEYRFYIVDTPTVNAFALPGGHIYLTVGLIARTRSGEEFAGILAHEIGHVAARHGIQRLQRELRTESLVSVLYTTILGGEPEILRDNSLRMANSVWSMRHSRNDEREADVLALEYLNSSGVDPHGMVSLLEVLHAEEQADGEYSNVDWFSTHPLTSARVDAARASIAKLGPRPAITEPLNLSAYPVFRTLLLSQTHESLIREQVN
jgi:predicted Zn-dependent protease